LGGIAYYGKVFSASMFRAMGCRGFSSFPAPVLCAGKNRSEAEPGAARPGAQKINYNKKLPLTKYLLKAIGFYEMNFQGETDYSLILL
jgi:hypothetical protein